MKKISLIIALMLQILYAQASFGESREKDIFEPGRTWCVNIVSFWPANEVTGSITYTVESGEEIEGQTYSKITEVCSAEDGNDGVRKYYLMREENGKIYRYNNDTKTEKLLFDCNMKKGELSPRGYRLTRIEKEVTASGIELRHYLFLDEYDPTFRIEYIEGIGYLDAEQFVVEATTGSDRKLRYCRAANGTLLYGDDTQTSVSTLPSNNSHPNPLYDLQGRKLQHEPARGIYIKDGRKWVK